jgi:hypothetical protein
MDFGEYNIHELLWEGNENRIIREYVIVFQDSSLDLLGRFLTFCSIKTVKCIDKIKDIILHIDDREWLNKNFWIFDDNTPEPITVFVIKLPLPFPTVNPLIFASLLVNSPPFNDASPDKNNDPFNDKSSFIVRLLY